MDYLYQQIENRLGRQLSPRERRRVAVLWHERVWSAYEEIATTIEVDAALAAS